MDKQRARQILDGFTEKTVLVVGDVMLDEYVSGRVSRVSPEAPVMVVDADAPGPPTSSTTFVPWAQRPSSSASSARTARRRH